MKKVILTFVVLVVVMSSASAQIFRLGIKAGPNFSSLSGEVNGVDLKSRTGFHGGAVAELKPAGNFAIQAEALFSAQGADSEINDLDFNYVAVPVLAKYYIIPDVLALEAGPQFSFLVDEAEEAFETKSFDLAVAGGASVHITKSFFASARYTAGVTKVAEDVDLTNSVIQISLGYFFL